MTGLPVVELGATGRGECWRSLLGGHAPVTWTTCEPSEVLLNDMKTILSFAVLSVSILGVAAACSSDDDGDSTSGSGGAGGVGGSLTSTGGAGGTAAGGSSSTAATGAGGTTTGGTSTTGGAAGAPEGGGAGEAGAGGEGGEGSDPLAPFTVIDLNDVKTNPSNYEGDGGWFEFRPNLQKLILAGEEQTQHIAILWYTVIDGAVGLHLHSKTESVYVIDGTQTDAKGTYTNGTVYFNPPGSGHQISDSSGFFLLAYAAPPNFMDTDLIEEYTPVTIDTTDPDLTTEYDFVELADGLSTYTVPLDEDGGMAAELIETSASDAYTFDGNYILVLEGTCVIQGASEGPGMLIVAKTIANQTYEISASSGTCLAMGISF